jgi:hypothetical protein
MQDHKRYNPESQQRHLRRKDIRSQQTALLQLSLERHRKMIQTEDGRLLGCSAV